MCGLTSDHAHLSLARMAAPYHVQRQPTGCAAGEAMVPSQGTNEREWRVLSADNSLEGWTRSSEVQEKIIGKARYALFTCMKCSQRKIVCELIGHHIDLSLVGIAGHYQV